MARKSEFIKVNVTATFDIPRKDYAKFRARIAEVIEMARYGERPDWSLDYLALDQTERDTIVAD